MGTNRKYDAEFKQEAVRLVIESGMKIREVERDLGITHGVLKDWVRKSRENPGETFSGILDPECPEAELKRLRKENARLQRERDILKKAVAIFSTDPHRYSDS